jgi:hypothetical protein
LFASKFLIEVTSISATVLCDIVSASHTIEKKLFVAYNCREIRRRDALVEHIIEIDVFKEWMPLDFFRVAFARSEAARRVSCQKLRDELTTIL